MKTRLPASILLALLLSFGAAFGQSEDRWQVLAMGGVFSPIDDEVQNVYGASPTGTVWISAPVGKNGRIRFGGGLLERRGDPFYQSRDFYLPDAGKLSLRQLSLTLEARGRSQDNPRVYFGAGVDYVFGEETIQGLDKSTGGAIGAHFSLTPEIRISPTLALTAEVSYRFLELTFRNGRDRYDFNLSGARLMGGLAFQLAN